MSDVERRRTAAVRRVRVEAAKPQLITDRKPGTVTRSRADFSGGSQAVAALDSAHVL